MPPRELLWTPGAIQQLAELIARREDRVGIRRCVEQHLLAVAGDVETAAQRWEGPIEPVWLYRFRCEDRKDGKVVSVHIQAELEVSDHIVAVLACGAIPL